MFITVEGIEGCGKSTLIRNLEPLLQGIGKKILCTREPGSSSLGKHIRPILLETASEPLSVEAELLLFLADRAEHVEKVIKPALKENTLVLCDRYCHSTFAYQGYGRGLDLAQLERLNTFASSALMPDLILLLDIPVEKGLMRANARNSTTVIQEGKFERESVEFHTRIREGFLAMAAKSPSFIILNGEESPENIAQTAFKIVKERLK